MNRPVSRPTHWRLTRAEQEQIDAEHQRGREIGFLSAILFAVSPVIVVAVAQVLSAIRGL